MLSKLATQRTDLVTEPASGAAWNLIHDFCFDYGGAERVTAVLARRVLPDAAVHLLGGTPELAARMAGNRRVTATFPWLDARSYRHLTPALAAALAWREPLPGNALASSYALAHHVRVEGEVVVYCHSPLRQLWSSARHHRPDGRIARLAVAAAGGGLRRADRHAAARAVRYVATSWHVRDRIRVSYGLDDVPIVHPPVEREIVAARTHPPREEWLLYAGRLVEPYKRVSLLIDAVRGTSLKLIVAGDGRDRARLEASAPANVHFVGRLSTPELVAHYERAAALVMPSEEDFGMVAAEAQSCGTPVIALARGGGGETVVDGWSGLHFDHADPVRLRRLLHNAVRRSWSHTGIARDAADRYGEDRFVDAMSGILGTSPAPRILAGAGSRA